jgi:hypothetical protein
MRLAFTIEPERFWLSCTILNGIGVVGCFPNSPGVKILIILGLLFAAELVLCVRYEDIRRVVVLSIISISGSNTRDC